MFKLGKKQIYKNFCFSKVINLYYMLKFLNYNFFCNILEKIFLLILDIMIIMKLIIYSFVNAIYKRYYD